MQHRYQTPAALRHDARTLKEDAQALIEATAQITDDKVTEARERLSEALERGRHTYQDLQKKAVQGAKAADETIRTHPYQAAAITFCLGLVGGLLLARRS